MDGGQFVGVYGECALVNDQLVDAYGEFVVLAGESMDVCGT